MKIRVYLKRIIRAVLTTAAIALGVLIQLAVVFLALFLLPDQVANQIAIPILLVSPFLIGTGSYFIYQRVIGQAAIRAEAERWLAQRSLRSRQLDARIRWAKNIAVWIPAIVVGGILLFLPETFGIVTQIFRPGPAKLIGYEVRFPIGWMVFFDNSILDSEYSYAKAFECKGPLRSGLRRALRFAPRSSTMSFSASRKRIQAYPAAARGQTLAEHRVPLANEWLDCREYVLVRGETDEDQDARAVDCRNADGTFLASFYGDRGSIPTFYQTLATIRSGADWKP